MPVCPLRCLKLYNHLLCSKDVHKLVLDRLDIVFKITMFKVFIVSNGIYNCAAWTAGTEELLTLNTTARSILMRIFGFRWYHHVSYDYLVKLCRLMGCHMYPMHLFVKMQRLSFFGHIIRMENDSLLKKLLFGEIVGGKRAVGGQTPSWIDRVKQDLYEFGLDHKNWSAIQTLAMDRNLWRKAIKTDGVERAYQNWLSANTNRRRSRMIKEGVKIISPEMVSLTNVDDTSRKVKSFSNYLERTPLSKLPKHLFVNIIMKLGPIKSMEILEATDRVHNGERNREMNVNDKIWQKPFIADLKNQCIVRDEFRAECEEIETQRQNWYDKSDVDDIDNVSEKFEIESVVSLEKRGAKLFFKVIWKPRSLCAHKTYPEYFPELQGKAWPVDDENNWICTLSPYYLGMRKKFKEIMDVLKQQQQQQQQH